MTTDHDEAIVTAARVAGLDAALVMAVVMVESGGDEWAWNPEPKYRYFWDVRAWAPFRHVSDAEIANEAPPSDFHQLKGDRDQEWWGQQASWGLMQIMGSTAREHRCQVPYLSELCRPSLGLYYGCAHLASLVRWAEGDTLKAVAAYNAGRGGWAGDAGQRYAAKVSLMMGQVRG